MTTPKRHAAALFSATFVTVCVLFLIHRGFTYGYLNGSVPAASPVSSLLVGMLSDIWVAFLLATLIGLPAWAVSFFSDRAALAICLIFVALITGGLCAHQGYVEFFRFQIEPFHIKYLADWQFVSSNSESFFTLPNAVMIIGALVLTKILFLSKPVELGKKQWGFALAVVTILSLAAHNRNIHYRVQWFIPENLQTNLLETLYLRSKARALADPLPADAFSLAASRYLVTQEADGRFDRTLFSASSHLPDDELAVALRDSFSSLLVAKKQPAVIIALMESFRPSETGVFGKDKPSLTPFFDQLTERGIMFTRAFSTGSVTRGGQEAVLCGNASGRSTSLMRNYDNLNYVCLTDLLAEKGAHLFWYHGGDGRFDNQEVFWRKHGVKDLMTIRSFPESAPKTGWGISDKVFFTQAVQQLNRSGETAPFSLGILLSVTNHIPWRLPEDYQGPDIKGHPSWQTTRYTDEALERLTVQLRENGRWDSTLLFIVSDHGNKVPPYTDLYKGSANQEQFLQSHINLVITGGIAEAALAATGKSSALQTHPVSQTDVAATIAFITGSDTSKLRIMGKSLFDKDSTYPILSQTEDGIFIPALDRLISYKDAAGPLPDPSSDDWIFRFHFQAVNEFLMEMRTSSR